jgi:hypothetical protein
MEAGNWAATAGCNTKMAAAAGGMAPMETFNAIKN